MHYLSQVTTASGTFITHNRRVSGIEAKTKMRKRKHHTGPNYKSG